MEKTLTGRVHIEVYMYTVRKTIPDTIRSRHFFRRCEGTTKAPKSGHELAMTANPFAIGSRQKNRSYIVRYISYRSRYPLVFSVQDQAEGYM